MGHLTNEALARLVDDRPDEVEARHLRECRICAEELTALRAQTEALGSLPAMRPPRGDWEALEARLLAEGLIDAPAGRRSLTFPRAIPGGWVTQVAAALVLFLGGSMMGARFGGDSVTPGPGLRDGSLPAMAAGSDESPSGSFLTTLDEAAQEVRRTEQDYIEAMVRYRQLMEGAGQGVPSTYDPASRFAALEAISAASQAAVREAPTDPFLNGILASVMAERQSYVQTLNRSNEDNWY
jgi:hypothetical protein